LLVSLLLGLLGRGLGLPSLLPLLGFLLRFGFSLQGPALCLQVLVAGDGAAASFILPLNSSDIRVTSLVV
jgi:hypothetical protein